MRDTVMTSAGWKTVQEVRGLYRKGVSSENGSEGNAKLNRDERPPTGQSEEALRFHSTFRRQFRSSISKVPLLEVVNFPVLSYGSFEVRILKEEGNWRRTAQQRCHAKSAETSRGASDGAAARPVEGGKPEAVQFLGVIIRP